MADFTLTGDQLAITTIACESGNQPHEGRVAVGIVGLNRMTLRYSSDGTPIGTWLHRWAFSEYWAGMEHGKYQQIAFDLLQAEDLAQADFEQQSAGAAWADCELAWKDAQAWFAGEPMSFTPGPAFQKLDKQTVLYLNPKISSAAWATSDKLVAAIYDHTFFHG